MRAIVIFLLAAAIIFCDGVARAESQNGKLLKIVVLSRHGVRSPTQSQDILKSWSQKEWPAWPVKKGELTPRGARLVSAMWNDIQARLSASGLLPENSCPSPEDIYIRADSEERTRATASAIVEGLAHGCQLGFAALPEGAVDPLFHPVKAGLYKFNPFETAREILSRTNGGLSVLQEKFARAISLAASVAGPPAPALCERFGMAPGCSLADLPNAISLTSDGSNARLLGPLDIVSSLAEIFLLEYAQWPESSAGWGLVNENALSQLLPVHASVFDLVNRAPVVAWAKGGALLSEISAALFSKHFDNRVNNAKLIIFVGHDTNIANIGGLLNLNWNPVGYPQNAIPPAGALFFELWEKNSKKEAQIRFYSQTPEVLHEKFQSASLDSELFAPSETWAASPPVVGEARFDESKFMELVEKAVKNAPMAPAVFPPITLYRCPLPLK